MAGPSLELDAAHAGEPRGVGPQGERGRAGGGEGGGAPDAPVPAPERATTYERAARTVPGGTVAAVARPAVSGRGGGVRAPARRLLGRGRARRPRPPTQALALAGAPPPPPRLSTQPPPPPPHPERAVPPTGGLPICQRAALCVAATAAAGGGGLGRRRGGHRGHRPGRPSTGRGYRGW